MKTVSSQTEPAPSIPLKKKFDPERHYVSVQIPDGTWEGDQMDRLLDIIDPVTGVEAYRIEARGDNPEERRITGDRRKAILSCSKDYIARIQEFNSNQSQHQARTFNTRETHRAQSVDGRQVTMVEDESFVYKPNGTSGIV